MDPPRRAPGAAPSAEKQELLEAVKHGRMEPANPGEDGRARWRFTHRGVVFITDNTKTREIMSWRIEDTGEEIERALLEEHSDAETGTHVVLVVDDSGSMRTTDVHGYTNRKMAVYDCLVKDFLRTQLQRLEGRGGEESSVLVTLIRMNRDATVVFEREPLHARLEATLLAQMDAKAKGHGNYLEALDCAVEVLREDRGTNRQLFLLFLSDGAPRRNRFALRSASTRSNSSGILWAETAPSSGRWHSGPAAGNSQS